MIELILGIKEEEMFQTCYWTQIFVSAWLSRAEYYNRTLPLLLPGLVMLCFFLLRLLLSLVIFPR